MTVHLLPNPTGHKPSVPLTFYVDVGRAERAAREIEHLEDSLAELEAQGVNDPRIARKLEPRRRTLLENLERARATLASLPAYTHDRAVVQDVLDRLAYVGERGREKYANILLGVVNSSPGASVTGVPALLESAQQVAMRDIVDASVTSVLAEIEALRRDRAADLDILTPVVELLKRYATNTATTALDVAINPDDNRMLYDSLTMTAFAALSNNLSGLAAECAALLPGLPPALVPVEVNIPVKGEIEADPDAPPFEFFDRAGAWPIQTRRIGRINTSNSMTVWPINASEPDFYTIMPTTRIVRYYPLAAVKPAL